MSGSLTTCFIAFSTVFVETVLLFAKKILNVTRMLPWRMLVTFTDVHPVLLYKEENKLDSISAAFDLNSEDVESWYFGFQCKLSFQSIISTTGPVRN